MKLKELTDKLQSRMFLEHKSKDTIDSYSSVVRQFFSFLSSHPETKSMNHSKRMEVYLTWRVKESHISASTQNSDYWALRYLGEKILGVEISKIKPLRAEHRDRIPHIVSRENVILFLSKLPDEYKLIGQLMYGIGLRVKSDCLRLRIKDIFLENKKIIIHESKGDKGRIVDIPEVLIEPLRAQIDTAIHIWQDDRRHRIEGVYLPHALAKKYPKASKSKDWFWLFPHPTLTRDENQIIRRHHLSETKVQSVFAFTRRALGLPEYLTPHTLRHCFATHFMEDLLQQGIPQTMAEAELIKILGHVDAKTLKWYVHLATPKNAVIMSPLDRIMKG